VEIGEAGKKLRADAGAIARRELPVTRPDRGRLGWDLRDAGDDAFECLVPGRAPEFVGAPIAKQRMEQPWGSNKKSLHA